MKTTIALLIFLGFNLAGQTLFFNPQSYQRVYGNQYDFPIQVKSDSQGNIYFLDNTSTLANSAITALVKCNSNGDTLWSRYFSESNTVDEYGTFLAIDNADNIIVGGNLTLANSNQSYAYSNFLIKYNSSGTVLAMDTFSNGKTYNQLKSISIDALNNIYVAAESQNTTFDKNILVYKVNSSLQRQWVKTYANTINKNDEPISILCNAQNQIYLAARTWSTSTNQNILVLKYDVNGTLLWTLNYDHLGLGKSEYLEGAVLNDTCIYLCAQYDQTGTNNRNFILKVSQSQSYMKSKQFDAVISNGFFQPYFISNNNALALSTHYFNYKDSLAITLLDTALNIKYNKNFRGNARPTNPFALNKCGGLTFNSDKKVCASLWLSDSVKVGAAMYAKRYIQIVQIDSLGAVVYSKLLNKYNQVEDSKVVWANNRNYVFGQCSWNSYGRTDVYLSTLDDQTGAFMNNTVFNCKEKGGSTDITSQQFQLPNGNFVLTTNHSIMYNFPTIDIISPAYQLQNSILLRDSVDVNDSLLFINKDAYNNIYSVVARTYTDTSSTQINTIIRVYKHNINLQQLWVKDLKYITTVNGLPKVALSDSGNLFMNGQFNIGLPNSALIKLDNMGVQQWSVAVNTGTTQIVNGKGLVCNTENVVYLYGAYQTSSPSYQNFGILKFNANSGGLLGITNYTDSLSVNQDVINHAIVLNDKLIATGRYGNGYQFTASIDTANLQLNWIRFLRYNNTSGANGGHSITAYQNDIFVIGWYGITSNYLNRILYTRYDASGNMIWTKNYLNPNSDWRVTDRYACASQNGSTAILATSEDVGSNMNKDFKILNYDYATGNLINSIAWTFTTTVPGCGTGTGDDVPLNINRNGPSNYLLTGYVNTMESGCINIFLDTFYGSLNPSVVTGEKERMSFENGIKVFPNPGNTELNILLAPEITGYKLSVYNMLGENVIQAESGANFISLNTEGLINGIYFIKVKLDDKELSAKWIKSN